MHVLAEPGDEGGRGKVALGNTPVKFCLAFLLLLLYCQVPRGLFRYP